MCTGRKQGQKWPKKGKKTMNYTQCGSALALPYADGIAQTCVTSPPYYGLRDYGTARWEGGDAGCDHVERMARGDAGRLSTDDRGGNINQTPVETPMRYKGTCGKCGARRIDAQIGLEQTPAAYVAQIVAAMREVWRVLRPDGTLWLNLGDSYASTAPGTRNSSNAFGGRAANPDQVANMRPPLSGNLKPKDLMGIPWRVAFALQDDGWYLRSDIVWAKPNPMPESVTDRPTKAHEYVFLLAKQPRYFYDAEAIKEESSGISGGPFSQATKGARLAVGGGPEVGRPVDTGSRNARSVWNIATTPYSGAHFATMPPELARRCILAGSSARGQCPKCGAPWHRVIEKGLTAHDGETDSAYEKGTTANRLAKLRQAARERGEEYANGKVTTGWAASCDCHAGDPVPQIVLDPFAGSGTTAMVALQNGRRAIGTELNPAYLRLQDARTQVTLGLGM
jgi:DNA modification methylase